MRKKSTRPKKKPVKLWPESIGTVHDWVQHVNANRAYGEDIIGELSSCGLPLIRSAFKYLRESVKERGIHASKSIYIPSLCMTFQELALFSVLKRNRK